MDKEKLKVKCLVSFVEYSKAGKVVLKGQRGEMIEVTTAQAKRLVAERKVAAPEAEEEAAPAAGDGD